MKKVFFFDIDDTILPVGNNGIIPESTKLSIQKLQQLGHDVFIATGKNHVMIKDILKQLNLNNYITSNGQVIAINDEIYYDNPFQQNQIDYLTKEVTKFNQKYGENTVLIGCQENDDYYVVGQNNEESQQHIYDAFNGLSIPLPRITEKFSSNNIYQIWVLGNVQNIKADQYEDKFQIFRWDYKGCDVLPKEVSKAKAIQHLLDNYYQEPIETYAFGDGFNDIAMLQMVDNGIAMGNANDELKKVADHITTSTKEDGIYKFLQDNKII